MKTTDDALVKGHWEEEIDQRVSLQKVIPEILDELMPREKRVIELRFGLSDERSRTLKEVGQIFGVSRERIRQIEYKALRELRHPSRSRKLKNLL